MNSNEHYCSMRNTVCAIFFCRSLYFLFLSKRKKRKSISQLLQHLACVGALKIRAPYLFFSSFVFNVPQREIFM